MVSKPHPELFWLGWFWYAPVLFINWGIIVKRILWVVLFCLFVLSSTAFANEVIFFDDFEDGMDSAWSNPDGGWVAEDGHATVTTSCGFDPCNPNLYAGGPDHFDYIVSFDVMITEAFTYHGAGVRCSLAMSNPYEVGDGATTGYGLGLGWSSDGSPENAMCQIQRFDESSNPMLAEAIGADFWLEVGVLYRLKMGRVGSELKIKKWTVGEPEPDWMLSATDDTYHNGYWLPNFWNNVGWIDNFKVEVIEDDVPLPVQWTEAEGGNGHWYEYVEMAENVIWEDAKNMAVSMGGHLATITSDEENQWVIQNVVVPNDPTGLVGGPLLGGFQNHSSPSYSEPDGGWEWVTGEPWGFTAWQSGEPNDVAGGSDYLQIWRWSALGWNDTSNNAGPNTQFCFLVEYDTPYTITLPYTEDFNDGIANGFEVVNGTWDVVDGQYHCYNNSSGTKQISTIGELDWTNYKVDVDILAHGAPIQELLVRYQSPDDWYVVTVLPEPRNSLSLYKCTDGTEEQLLYMDGIFNEADVYHHMTVEVFESTIQLIFDGELLFTYEDVNSPILAGKVGLNTFADGSVGWHEVFFDNLEIVAINGISDPSEAFSLQFDGIDDYVSIPNSASIQLTSDFSFSAWIKTDPLVMPSARIIEKGNWTDGWGYSLAITSEGDLAFQLINSHGHSAYAQVVSSRDIVDGGWHHIAGVVRDGEYIKLFIDGALDSQSTIFDSSQTLPVNTADLLIGIRHDWGYPLPFMGVIDEVTIWQRALTEEEIVGLMFASPESNDVGLGGYWSFNEGVGTFAYDYYGGGNMGTINGASWSTDVPALLSPLQTADTPNDQGGFLNFSWASFPTDALSLPDSVVTYDVQRLEDENWTTITTITATQADNYQVTIATPDIFTVGQPEPFSQYRIVANSSDPLTTYNSVVRSTYSIDNLAPPKPEGLVYEDDNNRYIICGDPDTQDLLEVCLYRGTTPAFVPEEPQQCGEEFIFTDTKFSVYYYRIQFSDIHGNLSEFSEVMGSGSTSGVGDSLPLAFAMEQNFPNPFNPQTTIKFSLPQSSPVTLRIYDVSGKLVRNLISGQVMEAGHREKVWNGQDANNQAVSAGIYFYKLTAGEFEDVKRMALVK
jgi:hypothetical protein